MTWSDWETKGEDWKRICAGIRPTLEKFARRNQMKVSPWHWDEPSLTLSWESRNFRRNIRVRIEGEPGEYQLALAGAIWRDIADDGQRIRQFNDQSNLGSVYIGDPESAETSLAKLENSLLYAFKEIDSLSDTTGEVKLPEGFAV
jgi:hypothetical protein